MIPSVTRLAVPSPSDDRFSGKLKVIGIYLILIAAGNFIWEVLQLPLYTIWTTSSTPELAFAVVHCTAGDVLIALASLLAALVVVRTPAWPLKRQVRVAIITIIFGMAYTIVSEWLNVEVRGSWAYSRAMPVIPLGFFSPGLSPVLQWLIVPVVAFWTSYRRSRAPG